MLSNLVASLIKHKKIKTTHARAKELRRFIEPLITFAKQGDLHSRRQVLKKIKHKKVIVGIVGLGYVGLPLALACCKKGFKTMQLYKHYSMKLLQCMQIGLEVTQGSLNLGSEITIEHLFP